LTDESILIDLGVRLDARRVAHKESFVHQDALSQLRTLLHTLALAGRPKYRDLDDSQSHCPVSDREGSDRRHDTIAILGGRGSGKTTFLLSVLDAFESPRGNHRAADKSQQDGLLPELAGAFRGLGVLDPTLIATKESVLLTIISRIQSLIDETDRSKRPDAAEQWDRALRHLAGGLAALDEVGANPLAGDGWEDPHFVVEEGLSRVKNSRLLERRFHDFLECSLRLIRADTFILGIDDIDTAFERGWPVLETLRRYLTSPKLIVLIAGDLELFSALVRKRQWENLGDLPFKFEPEQQHYYKGMVDRLEDQYLLKLIKPENRIFLGPIYRHHARSDQAIRVRLTDKTERKTERPLKELLDEFLKAVFYLHRDTDRRLFTRVLLGEPIRTVVQVLRACEANAREAPRDEVIDRLLHVFSGPLSRLGLQPHHVREMGPQDFGPMIAQRFVELDILNQAYRLWPDLGDAMLNLGLIALGAKISRLMADRPAAILEYMIKVGLTREIELDAPTNPRARRAHMQLYVRYTELDSTETALGVAVRAAVFLRTDRGRVKGNTTKIGTIALYGSETAPRGPMFLMYGRRDDRQGLSSETTPAMINYYFKMLVDVPGGLDLDDDGQRSLLYNTPTRLCLGIRDATHAFLVSQPIAIAVDRFGTVTPIVSIFNLIAILCNILECHTIDDVKDVMTRYTITHFFRVPSGADDDQTTPAASPSVNRGDQRTARSVHDGNEPNHLQPLAKALLAWANKVREWQGSPLAVHIVIRMWERFHHSLQELDMEFDRRQARGERVYAGEALHHMIIAFLSAVLVEGALYAGLGSRINLDSPDFAGTVFRHNLNAFEAGLTANTPILFRILWSCPLWGYYLDPGEPPTSKDDALIVRAIYEMHRTCVSSLLPPEASINPEILYLTSEKPVPNLFPLLNSLLIYRPEHLSVPPQPPESQA